MDKIVVTGGAGFIGSNLAEHLSSQGHKVVIVDNFSTGKKENVEDLRTRSNITVLESDIADTAAMRDAFREARYVFHQAAIPSVPRSIADPEATHRANITGTLSVLLAARDCGVERVVVASSSSIYGDDPNLPKQEPRFGRCLSPYALSKFVCEEYSRLFHDLYHLQTVSLRYFNVFGPRQDPKSEYAAVIPKFVTRLLAGTPPIIYGDGEQSRDFTFISNVIDANWRAATQPRAAGQAFNIGCGTRTTLNELVAHLNAILGTSIQPEYAPQRAGDVRHSVADVSKARDLMEYAPAISLREGLRRVVEWYRGRSEAGAGQP